MRSPKRSFTQPLCLLLIISNIDHILINVNTHLYVYSVVGHNSSSLVRSGHSCRVSHSAGEHYTIIPARCYFNACLIVLAYLCNINRSICFIAFNCGKCVT